MGRTWLALAVLACIAAPAHADKAMQCQCAERITYPDLDAVDVPTNQRAIELQPWDADAPIKITDLGDLAPDSDYHRDDAPFLRFHTGKGPDLVPPATPKDVHPSIAIHGAHNAGEIETFANQTSISMWGTYDVDTQFLDIEIVPDDTTPVAGGRAHIAMRSYNPFACGIPLRTIGPGPAHIKVWAIDRAGNRSAEPWVGDVMIQAVDEDPTGEVCMEHRHHFKCGMGSLILIFVVPVFYLIALLVLWGVSAIRRSRIRSWPGEHVTIPHGESVARIAARTYAIKLLVSAAGVASLWKLDYPITAVLLSPLVIVWLFEALRARGVVHRFNQPVNRLERREDWLLVDHTLLYCGRRAWNKAAHVPTATIAPKK